MARPAEIPIRVTSNSGPETRKLAADLRALASEQQRTARAMQQSSKEAERLANQSIAKVNKEFNQLQRESQQTAQAQIQAAVAAKNYGAALAILDRELAKGTNSQKRAYQLQAQQARIFRQAQQEVSSGARESSGAIGLLSGAVGQLGLAFGAGAIAQGTLQLAQQGAQVIRTRQAFDELAQKSGTTGEALLTALRAASGGEISDLNLQLAANKANLLGVADSAQEFGVLMEIARDRASKLGLSTSQAFDDLVTGLGRGSALILDNLGIIVEAEEVNGAYAKSIGKTAAQLTEAEKKQALINEVIRQGQSTLQGAAAGGNATAAAFAQAKTAAENLKNNLSVLISEALAPAATGFAFLAQQASLFFDGTAQGAATAGQNIAQLLGVGSETQSVVGGVFAAFAQYTGIIDANTTATQTNATTTTAAASAQLTQADAIAQATARLQEQQAALQEEAAKALVSEANSKLLANTKAQLATQADAAAQALLNAGATGAQEAARLAASSSLVDQLTAAHYRLAVAAQASANAQALQRASNDRIAQENATRNGRTVSPALGAAASEAQAAAARDLARQQAIARAKEAEQAAKRAGGARGGLTRNERADLALGDDEADLKLLREKLAKLKKGSTEYKEVLAKIQATEARIRKGGARAGAAGDRQAEREEKARLDLLNNEERLAALRQKLATQKLPEVDRLELIKEIRDLEEKITDEQQRRREAAVDAQLAAIDDRKKRREEDRELDRARRVLESSSTSEAQKAAAQDVIDRIPLEQQKRALDIADKQRDAGGVPPVAAVAPALPSSPARPGTPTRPAGATNFLPITAPQLSTAALSAASTTLNLDLDLIVTIDGQQVAAAIQPKIQSNGAQNLRIAINRVKAGGS